MDEIIRSEKLLVPKLKKIPEYSTWNRFDEKSFAEYDSIINSENYRKWKSGINFLTNRKIKIGGKLHKELKNNFKIPRGDFYYYSDVDELDGVDKDEYMQETNELDKEYIQKNKQVKLENDEIEMKNKEIEEQNKEIMKQNETWRNLQDKIKLLKSWNEYIVLEGKKYGLPHVLNRIHMENDCLGEMEYSSCECNNCENSYACSYSDTSYHRCNKCYYRTRK